MPQEPSPDWKEMLGERWEDSHERLLHTFGNLTLTAYNPELGNLGFEHKKQQLSISHIELNRWIYQQTVWNETTIEARAAMLADIATKLWLGPESFS